MPKKVLFITADQMRADCAGFAGHPLAVTPNLDALARESLNFTHAFSVTAPCGPSRASLLTGQYAMNHRAVINGAPLDARHTNIAREVRKLGMEPALFGYTDSTVDPRTADPMDPAATTYEGVLPGFRHVASLNMAHLEDWLGTLARKGYDLPENQLDIYAPNDDAIEGAFNAGPAKYDHADSDSAYIADAVCDYIRARQDKAWLAHVVFFKPHPPFVAAAPYHNLINPDDITLPGAPDHGHDLAPMEAWRQLGKSLTGPGQKTSLGLLDDHNRQQVIATYLGMIAEMDDHLGRILKTLKETGQDEDTLIIFTSDHGEELGAHGLWGKGGFYDGSYRVPLLIRDPNASSDSTRGQSSDALVESVDLMPTILDWLDHEVPITCDGQSLLPITSGDARDPVRDGVMIEYDWRQGPEDAVQGTPKSLAVWRTHQYKLVVLADGTKRLFALTSDPDELNSIHDEKPEIADQLTTSLLTHRMQMNERTLLTQLVPV